MMEKSGNYNEHAEVINCGGSFYNVILDCFTQSHFTRGVTAYDLHNTSY